MTIETLKKAGFRPEDVHYARDAFEYFLTKDEDVRTKFFGPNPLDPQMLEYWDEMQVALHSIERNTSIKILEDSMRSTMLFMSDETDMKFAEYCEYLDAEDASSLGEDFVYYKTYVRYITLNSIFDVVMTKVFQLRSLVDAYLMNW